MLECRTLFAVRAGRVEECQIGPGGRFVDATAGQGLDQQSATGHVPAEVVGTADVVCRKCQEAAIDSDGGSDDEVVSDEEESGAALADVSDADLLAEIARRLGDEEALTKEESKETKDHRN